MPHYDDPRDSDPPIKAYQSFSYDELYKKQTPEQREQERKKALSIALKTMERLYGKVYIEQLRAEIKARKLKSQNLPTQP